MRPPCSVVGLALLVAASGCGSRTPLGPSAEDAGAGADASDAAVVPPGEAGDEGGGGYVYCDARIGPVPASELPEVGPVPRCDKHFPRCVDIAGQWACCHGPGPFNGPMGSCRF